MFGYLVEAGNYKTISKPSCTPGSYCVKEDRGNSSVHGLPETQFHHGKRCFSTTRIDEALQAVHSSNWFLSFYLAQGYLQLAMEESDIKKTAFRAGSMGLYEFTCMPFGFSNAGSSFCHLMEQCLGDEQFVTLLLYLDDICIFAPTIDDMLD